MKRILLTGITGMVGSNIMSHFLKNTDYEIIGIASWGLHKGKADNILNDEHYQNNQDRVKIVTHDLNKPFSKEDIEDIGEVDIILNIASDSHVDRSITDPVPFVQNNVNLALNMLELARIVKPKMFVQFSTDEVYGQAPEGINHKEWSVINPSNPYSASKAAQEAISISYWRTYGVPVIITNTMNVFAENQDKEKFIPLCIDKILKGETIYIHGDSTKQKAGTRFYIHARNVADALHFIIEKVEPKMYPKDDRMERFNIVGEVEIDNLSLAQKIADILGLPLNYEIVSFHATRPGHDLRYALDGQKLKAYGYEFPLNFEDSFRQTVLWLKETLQ